MVKTKTLTFAAVHFSVAFGTAYVLTGSIGISGALALIEPMINTAAFYFHEKIWKKIEIRSAGKTENLPIPSTPTC